MSIDNIFHQWGGLRIPKENEAQALFDLVENTTSYRLIRIGTGLVRQVVPFFDEAPESFERAMNLLGFAKDDEDTGWRLGDYQSLGDYRWEDHSHQVLMIVTRYAEPMQMLMFENDEGEFWGYMARDGKAHELKARVQWFSTEKGDEDEVVESW